MWKLMSVLIVMTVVFVACKIKNNELTPISPMYRDMRSLWLAGLPKEQLKGINSVGEKEIYVAGIEFTSKEIADGKNRIFIVGSLDGDASVYFQSGNEEGVGGYIGGQGHEYIINAAKRMVVNANESLTEMSPGEFPEVIAGNITFFALSKNGTLYTAQVNQEDVIKSKNRFSTFFYDANDIITGFRLVQEKQQAER